MKVYRSEVLSLEASVIAIGAFDGVHKGHQKVITETVKQSQVLGVPSLIYTFDPPPRAYFQGVKVLSTMEEKINKIRSLGIDYTVVATFDRDFINKSASSFIKELKRMKPLQIIVGEDFRFGYQRKGDIHLLQQYFSVQTISPICCSNGQRISSTRIRTLIQEGKEDQAIPLLT